MKINDFTMAEKALFNQIKDSHQSSRSSVQQDVKEIPKGAAGYYLVGLIKDRKGQKEKAIKYFEEALKQNPTLWCAYEKLVTYKNQLKVSEIFPTTYQFSPDANLKIIQSQTRTLGPSRGQDNTVSPSQGLRVSHQLNTPVSRQQRVH